MSTVKFGLIGCGSRGRGLAKQLLSKGSGVQPVALFDPDKSLQERFIEENNLSGVKVCDDYMEAVNTPGINWVMICSPNCYHREQICAALKAGLNVFGEKPMATTIEDCEAIYKAHKASGKLFATGFVMRYMPLYRKIKEILESGMVGKVISIDANENISPGHGGYIMQNWRRHTKLAGPHILEKCCHDLDILNWLVDSLPSRVASFGGLNFFVPENKGYIEKYRTKEGQDIFSGWEDPHRVDNPFTSDKDLIDNQVAILEYRNQVRVMFQATMSNAAPERRMYISCTDGTIISELYQNKIWVKQLGENKTEEFDFNSAGGHAGGDPVIMDELYESMVNNTTPKSSGDEGLQSAVVALGVDQARIEKKILDLEPVWKKLDR